MGKSYDFTFSDVKHTRTGTMICEKCGKPIIEGTYLNFKKPYKFDWRYINYHLDCALTNEGFKNKYEKFIEENNRDEELQNMREKALSMLMKLDGDEVDALCGLIKSKIDLHEGNITECEYDKIVRDIIGY